jgi:transposase
MRTKSFVGLDVHRNLVVATAVNPLGKRIRQSTFGTSPMELKRFLSRLPKPTKVVLEACHLYERFYEIALSTGAEVVVSHPRTTRMIAEASIKTDKVDSAALANLLRLDSIPRMFVPPPEVRALRKLYLEREFYTRTRTSIMRHAYARLAEHGVDYGKAVLQHKPQREKLRRHGIPEFDRALDSLEDLERTCRELDERVHDAFLGSEDAQLLATIPGIGEVQAAGIAGFLCPIGRFPNIDKLTSYVGLCPTTHQSSDTLYHGHLKPDVNRRLRSLLVGASWRHRIHAPKDDVARLARRVVRRKGKMRGSVVGAHKLLRIVYAILKQRRAYLPRAPERAVSGQWMQVPPARNAARRGMRRSTLGSPGVARRNVRLPERRGALHRVRRPHAA